MRTALGAMLVALAAIALLCAVTYGVVEAGLTRALATTVNADLAGLADVYASGGRGELVARLDDRQGVTAGDGRQPHYRLTSSGRTLAGEPGAWPRLDAARSAYGYVVLPGERAVYARATRLDRDLELVVAREYSPERQVLHLVLASFALAGCVIVAAVVALAWRQSRRLGARIERINAAYRDAAPEAIDGLTADAAADEVGELSRHSAEALVRLRRLVDSQRHVTDHVAHELRTPLLHLDGRLRSLPQSLPDGASRTIRLAMADIRGITTMLDALLDIASSEAQRGDRSALVPIDLSALANDFAEVYRGSMEEAGLHFVTAIAADVAVVGDRTQLGRLIANLLDNAIKYVPAGGTVRLEVAADPLLVVADDGPGIEPTLATRVFERFRRGISGSAPAGHGLGLALASSIAQRHDLTLTLQRSERGARFVLAGKAA